MKRKCKNMESVSLKKYLKSIIKLNLRELEAYKLVVDGHLKELNNSHANIEKIASRNISQDKFDGLEARVTILENYKSRGEGESKISDWIKLSIAAIAGSVLTILIEKLVQ